MSTEEKVMKSFCENLRYYMDSNKLSQRKLAARLNLANTTVSKWFVRGQQPSIVTCAKIAEMFEISVDDLIK